MIGPISCQSQNKYQEKIGFIRRAGMLTSNDQSTLQNCFFFKQFSWLIRLLQILIRRAGLLTSNARSDQLPVDLSAGFFVLFWDTLILNSPAMIGPTSCQSTSVPASFKLGSAFSCLLLLTYYVAHFTQRFLVMIFFCNRLITIGVGRSTKRSNRFEMQVFFS